MNAYTHAQKHTHTQTQAHYLYAHIDWTKIDIYKSECCVSTRVSHIISSGAPGLTEETIQESMKRCEL